MKPEKLLPGLLKLKYAKNKYPDISKAAWPFARYSIKGTQRQL